MPKKAKLVEPDVEISAQDEITNVGITDTTSLSMSEPTAMPEQDTTADEIDSVPENTPAELITSSQDAETPSLRAGRNARRDFYGLDFHTLDKDLSPREREEWNAIYASFRAGSLLTGTVAGIDSINVGNQTVHCLIVFDYRVKVLIPHSEIWAEGMEVWPAGMLRRYLGAEIDYVVTEVDRAGGIVLASRKKALEHKQWLFEKRPAKTGDIVTCRILAVSTPRMVVEYGGYEISLPANNVTYGTVMDLRDDYASGQTVQALVKDNANGELTLSVKEVHPHPFDGVELRHPKGTRRLCRIMGKYAGGLFCELEKGFTCMCIYSRFQKDSDFHLGDKVLVVITHYDYGNKLVYGRIKTGL